MAFLEWRRFNFFECHKVDNTKLEELLQDTRIVVSTSGNNHVIICDATGWAHLISRSWTVTSFKVHESEIVLAQQFPHDPYLVTVGEDEEGVNPFIKVWDWSRTDRHGNPILAHISRAVPSHLRPTMSSALAIHENKSLLAVGFLDGSVSLFRGDITRQRSWKMRTLSDSGPSPITGLAFKGKEQLFVVSRACVSVYWTSSDRSAVLDNIGASPLCSVLADKQLMIARPDAIYCYTTEGRGPCYALEGEKLRLDWFRNYLVITTAETPVEVSSQNRGAKGNLITILDIQNKFIVYTRLMGEVASFLNDWGSCYLLSKDKQMWALEERDLQYKMDLLFKKNLYDVAIRMASSQHYDAEGLMEICKQYGDHLYTKGDLKGAIDQYIKTIGYLETSYVIRKYLESRHLEPLIVYLEELHKKGFATEDHTTLLLTCFVKLDQHDHQGKLKQFINSKTNTLNFDVDIAIKVVRQVSPDDALTLASNHKRHDWYLKIITEDKKDYQKALSYLSDLEFDDADLFMKKYGNVLIQHAPVESTEFLKALCTDYKPRSKLLVEESSLSGARVHLDPDRAMPDDYVHLFLSNSEQLIVFLEHMVKSELQCSNLVYNALIEHYIHVWAKLKSATDKAEYEEKIMKVLRNPEANYDKDQTLIICQMLGFKSGILHLYEENKLWRAQVSVHMRNGEWPQALEVCRRRGDHCPRLWLDVLWWPPPAHYLPELLHVIGTEKLLSPILVLDCLASTSTYKLGDVRKYLINILKAENEVITREKELATKYKGESDNMKCQITNIQESPITFQSSKCAACSRPLELPTVHFLCQHSYHQHCFQSYSEHETECPACVSPTPRQEHAPRAAETLHARLHNDHDPYAVVAEYFGRGLFNKLTVLTPESEQKTQAPPVTSAPLPAPVPLPNYGPGAEARLRLEEGQSKQVFVPSAAKQLPPKGTTIIPIPEGRMRVMEATRYSTSLEANMNKLPAPVHDQVGRKDQSNVSQKISNAIVNKNPFEEDMAYDESMNPFAEDDDSTNPFKDDDDYDKNLNPFS